MVWQEWLLGKVDFGEAGEYRQFRFTFLMAVMLAGLPVCIPFIVTDWMGANAIGGHVYTVQAYVALTVVLVAVLRARPALLVQAIWIYSLATYLVHMSAFLLVPQDDMRVVWFYALIAGAYILLGQKGGGAIAVLSVVSLLVANRYSSAPLTSKGMGTWVASVVSQSVIFHVYTSRADSYFRRMHTSNMRLRHMAQHDALTGVLNLRAMTEVPDRLLGLARRQSGRYAVLFVDLDHFKRINDEHGHEAGDTVLKAVASCMSERLRKSDVLGRIGGEEFLAFLPDTDAVGALSLAEALRQDIESLRPLVNQQPLRITASIGVATPSDGLESLSALQKQADQAMYQAKAAGRNRVTVFSGREGHSLMGASGAQTIGP